ncbi:MAG: hypothetical protein AAGJ83_16130, partial [Planctomycetota bacterium]
MAGAGSFCDTLRPLPSHPINHVFHRKSIFTESGTRMLKNFSPTSLGINGRQSELIELALTYGFSSMDIDMYEMLRRSQRTSADDAAKFLKA